MKRLSYVLLCVGISLSLFTSARAQGDLDVFGYFQSTFTQTIPVDSLNKPSNTFAVQQLNVFFNKDLNESFNAFVNLEFTNSFSSERNWGALNLEEAWMRYAHSDAFNLKAGLLIPRFNNLNEIKNRTPILPYIIRPLVYEASISELIAIENYVPQRAYLQVYGNLPVSDAAKFDYAVYVGNSSREYIAATSGNALRGNDTSTYKMIGGRVGFTYDDLKVGVSGTYDRDNLNEFGLGDVPRTRMGVDLSYSIAGFAFEGELIMVNSQLTDEKEAVLKAISQLSPQVGTSTEKMFYYAYLTYNFSPAFYAFAGYSFMDDKLIRFFENGFTQITGGVGYRPIDQVAVKAQYAKYEFPDNPFQEWAVDYLYIGASVFF